MQFSLIRKTKTVFSVIPGGRLPGGMCCSLTKNESALIKNSAVSPGDIISKPWARHPLKVFFIGKGIIPVLSPPILCESNNMVSFPLLVFSATTITTLAKSESIPFSPLPAGFSRHITPVEGSVLKVLSCCALTANADVRAIKNTPIFKPFIRTYIRKISFLLVTFHNS